MPTSTPGKLWYTEGDAVVNLMKVKLDHNGTISIVPNFFNLDKIKYSREQSDELQEKIKGALQQE